MEVIRFIESATRHEIWELADAGWEDWTIVTDRFLAHAIQGITAEYPSDPVEWLEVNHWPISGRLIVFPSDEGPYGDRHERVCFELSSEHLATASRRISKSVSEANQDVAWATLAARVWCRIGECFVGGAAGKELADARRTHQLRIVAYDYQPGEGEFRLTEDGAYRG